MATPQPIASPTPPDLRSLLDSVKDEVYYGLNCAQVGKIVSFDAAKQSAKVQIQVLRTMGAKQVPYPVLQDCPVFVLGGLGSLVTVPINAGDPCLVVFGDRDIDNWFATGNVVAPNSLRAHDLSDGFVLVGFRNLTASVANYSTTDAQLRNAPGTGLVGVGADGKIAIKSPADTLKNSLDTLMDKLDQLCGNLTAWVNTGGTTPNPATVTAITLTRTQLTAVKTQIDSVLK